MIIILKNIIIIIIIIIIVIIIIIIIKAGIHMKAVFWLSITVLTQISRLRFKQSRISKLISRIYVLGRFVNFLVISMHVWR